MHLIRPLLLAGTIVGLMATSAAGDTRRMKVTSAAACGWLAKRVMLALLREDIVAANDFQQMHRSLGCNTARLATAFSCAVSPPGPASAANIRERVDACWKDPATATFRKPPAGIPARPPAERPEPVGKSPYGRN